MKYLVAVVILAFLGISWHAWAATDDSRPLKVKGPTVYGDCMAFVSQDTVVDTGRKCQ